MPPPHVPTILIDNSDNERDPEDHQDWCLRNLNNPVVRHAPRRAKHAPLELLCACFSGPLLYSPWNPHHCCSPKKRPPVAPAHPISSGQVLRGERVDVLETASLQQQSGRAPSQIPQAALKAPQQRAKGTRTPSATVPSLKTAPQTTNANEQLTTASQRADSDCHQSPQTSAKLSRQASIITADDREACASASQLLATMVSNEDGNLDELERVPATPEGLQGQTPSSTSQQQPTPSPNMDDTTRCSEPPPPLLPTNSQTLLLSSRSTVRSSPPIVFADDAESPVQSDHSVSSAILPQPGSALQSLSESIRFEGDDYPKTSSGRNAAKTRKRKATSPPAEQVALSTEHDEVEHAQGEEQEEYQSQDDSVLSSVRESQASVDHERYPITNGGEKNISKRLKRGLDCREDASDDRQGSVSRMKHGYGSQHGSSLPRASASGPSPPMSSPIESSAVENTKSASPPVQRGIDRLSSPPPSSLSPAIVLSSPLTNMSDSSLLHHVQSDADAGLERASSESICHTVGSTSSKQPKQSSLDANLLDIESYLQKDLGGYTSRLSY